MRCQKCPPAPQRAARLHGGSRKHILMVVWVLDLAVSLEGSVDVGLSSCYIRYLDEWIPGGVETRVLARAELGCQAGVGRRINQFGKRSCPPRQRRTSEEASTLHIVLKMH